jgi:thiol-disulfide isomerase/thioredoxin
MVPLVAGAALLGLAGFVYVVFLAASKPGPGDLRRYAQGAMAKLEIQAAPPPQPQTQFADATGKMHSLAEWRGKVAVVNFWATWCAPCVREMPSLAVLAKTAPGDVAIVPINFDRKNDHDAAVAEIERLSGGTLAFYAEPSFTIPFDVSAPGFPTTIIYARDGRELARMAGDADWATPEARAMVEAALAL